MALNPGAYTRRVIVQKPTESIGDSGGLTRSWTQHAVLWMAKEEAQGSESFVAESDQATETARFRTHYTAGLSPKMRLLVPGETTTLSSALSLGGRLVQVASADGFPLEGDYRARIASELVNVTDGQGGTTWTVSRGVDGTTAATATVGTDITHMEIYDIQSAHGDKGGRTETVINAYAVGPIG